MSFFKFYPKISANILENLIESFDTPNTLLIRKITLKIIEILTFLINIYKKKLVGGVFIY